MFSSTGAFVHGGFFPVVNMAQAYERFIALAISLDERTLHFLIKFKVKYYLFIKRDHKAVICQARYIHSAVIPQYYR